MGDFAEADSQLYAEHGDGTLQFAYPVEMLKVLAAISAMKEFDRGLVAQAKRDAAEAQRRRKLPPLPPPLPPLPPPSTPAPAPAVEKPLASPDSPPQQGAEEVKVPVVLKRRTDAPPLVSTTEPTHATAEGPTPLDIDSVIALIWPIAPTGEDAAALRERLRKNEPEPGQPHPTHALPAPSKPTVEADPVDLFSGAFTLDTVDLVVPTPWVPIAMRRSYRSGRPYFGPFGFGWDHVYNVSLRRLLDGSMAMWNGQLREQRFAPVGLGWEPEAGLAARLERVPGPPGVFVVTYPGGLTWTFQRPSTWSNTQRTPLSAITDRHGNRVQLRYDNEDRLASVLDEARRGLLFGYGDCGLLETVSDHTATRVVRYAHDAEVEHLIRVTFPATLQYAKGFDTFYVYDRDAAHAAMQHNILRIHDASDRLIVENEFGAPDEGWAFNAVVRQRGAGFEHRFEYEPLQYVQPDPVNLSLASARTLVRPPDGSLHTYTFNYRGDLLDHRFRLIRDGSFRVVATQWQHDREGNLSSQVGADGQRTFFTYDIANLDPCARRSLLRVERAAPLSSLVPSRIVFEAQYEPGFQLPTRTRDETGAETLYAYDLSLAPVGATGRLLRITLLPVVLADGTPQQAILKIETNRRGQVTATVSAEGRRVEWVYLPTGTDEGRLSAATRVAGGVVLVATTSYDVAGFAAQLVAPGGRVTRFVHNALGQIEQVDVPAVAGSTATVKRWFDDSGGVVRVERPAGSYAAALIGGTAIVDTYERDEMGCVHATTLALNTPERVSSTCVVDHEGRIVEAWDPLGTRTRRCYGEDGAMLSETVAAGSAEARKTAFVYNRTGRLLSSTGPGGEVTSYGYDVWGRALHIGLPSGGVRSFAWAAADRVISERFDDRHPGLPGARMLERRDFEYDERGRVRRVTRWSYRDDPSTADLLVTRHLHDADDNVREVRAPRGARLQFEFDAIGRPSVSVDPHGNRVEFTYDAAGDMATRTDVRTEQGVTSRRARTFAYDARGRAERAECLDLFTTCAYDDRDLPTERRAQNGVVTRQQFDGLGRLIEQVSDPGGDALANRYRYDAIGNLAVYTDPMGRSTAWTRDAFGEATAIEPPDGSRWTFRTDATLRTSEQQSPAGNRVLMTFPRDNGVPATMTCIGAPGHEPVPPQQHFFDALGRLVRTVSATEIIERRYDSLSRLIEETTRGATVRIAYDDFAGTVDLTFPDGRRERTAYGTEGLPTSVRLVTPGALGGASGETLLAIHHSTAGREVGATYGNGVEAETVQDEQDRPVRIEYRHGGAMLESCRLRYDNQGHRAVAQWLGAPATTLVHGFDGHARLVEEHHGVSIGPLADTVSPALQAVDVGIARVAAAAAPGIRFGLDGADTRTSVVGLNGVAVGETVVSGADHRVVAVGVDVIAYTPDAQRSLDGQFRYEHDALNRVRRVFDRTTLTLVAELRYDALSRIVAGSAGGQAIERWFADGSVIHETVGGGALLQHSRHPISTNAFRTGNASGDAYLHHDAGWSTACVTGAGGAVIERHRFDSFGAHTASAADGVTPLASLRSDPVWRGMPRLGGTPLFRTPARLYDPRTGTFDGRDPLLYADSPSPFAFAAHNPVDFADPTGLAKTPLGEASAPRGGILGWLREDSRSGGWRSAPRKGDLFEGSGPVDTGSIVGNYAVNSWISLSNMVKSAINVPFEFLNDLDDAMSHSRFGVEWDGPVRHMLPMMKGMGLAAEAPEGLTYLRGLINEATQLRRGGMGTLGSLSAAIGLWKPASRFAKQNGVLFERIGGSSVYSETDWARYQVQVAGSTEMVFSRTARSGGQRLIYLDTVKLNGLAVEAKFGNMGQLFNFERYKHFVRQSNDYLDIGKAFRLSGVQYQVSTELGASRVISAFTYLHPEALRSGFLTVRWVPPH